MSIFEGIFAAMLVSRNAQGRLDETATKRQLEFLCSYGIRGFAFNGATGEFASCSVADVRRSLQIARSVLPADASILCGVGAAALRETLALGALAVEANVSGLLVPAPFFFPYNQEDLSAFIRILAAEVRLPILLYNLPQFTTGFETPLSVELIRTCHGVAGIKDSSGSLDTLRTLTKQEISAARIIGNDRVLAQALTEGICDGVVSGVACVVPELILPLFASHPKSAIFERAAERLRHFIAKIEVLPAPWGLKAIAEARGISHATYPLPLSEQRKQQILEIQLWFKEWISEIVEPTSGIRAK
jgi:4-hydroxy-tetrahydrodipicolinate synthase